MTTSEALPATPVRSSWILLALACACQFMVILDASIVNVALPAVDRDLGFAGAGLAWVVDGYLLAFAGFMLAGGRAADLFGPRRMLTAGLLLFSGASLAAGLAAAPAVLVAARIAQGVGAALLAPATLVVINIYFTGVRERARAFGAWSAAGGVGGMAGALAGGALTTGLSWRWVFLINVPIGAVLIALALTRLAHAPARRGPLDLPGAICGTAGLAVLIYGVMSSTDRPAVVPIVAGLLLLGAFVLIEARAARPVLPLRLLRIRGVAVGGLLLVLFGAIAIAMWYFTALFLQEMLGYSALQAGLGQTPAALAFVAVARQAAPLLPRLGVRPLILAGCALFVAGFAWLAQAGAGTGYATGVLVPSLLVAAGIGLVFPTLMAAATADAPAGEAGIVGGIAATAQQAGGAIGLAALATLASGYDRVFLTAAGIAVVIAALGLLLPRQRSAAHGDADHGTRCSPATSGT
ncbi:MFS transporter [Actinoplanes sp. CA-142083]|uniref:MFS transporter n=1 Tax=Actinoplanes sp. CA-142083 TaxID=3239903 RepID=UPI003D911932